MPKTAMIPVANYVPKITRLKSETIEERNMRLYGCPLDHTPNAEALAAIEEGKAMLQGDKPSKWMTLDELMKDLHS
jgi:hypothetical protein